MPTFTVTSSATRSKVATFAAGPFVSDSSVDSERHVPKDYDFIKRGDSDSSVQIGSGPTTLTITKIVRPDGRVFYLVSTTNYFVDNEPGIFGGLHWKTLLTAAKGPLGFLIGTEIALIKTAIFSPEDSAYDFLEKEYGLTFGTVFEQKLIDTGTYEIDMPPMWNVDP